MWKIKDACVIIQINGGGAERFLNLAAGAGIPMREVAFQGRGAVRVTMRARDFRRLRPICRQTRCRVEIVERVGAPYRVHMLVRRKTLWIGCALALLLLGFLSTRILVISVTGAVRVPASVVLRALGEEGVSLFAPRGGLHLPGIADKVRVYDERIAWAGIDLDGVVCHVRIVEAEPIPALPDTETPCDIVAAKDGVVEEIAPLNGKACFAKGQAVRAGDVLIRGDITREGETERLLVTARGEVLARVYYYAEATVEATEEALTETGARAPYRGLRIGKWMLSETKPPFSEYIVSELAQTGPLGAVLPIRLETGAFIELALGRRSLTKAEQIEKALSEAAMRAYDKLPRDAAIVEQQSGYVELDGCVKGVVCIVTRESIGIRREIAE